MKILISNVNKKDSKKLIKWWNENTNYYHFLEKSNNKLYNVVRQF